MDDQSSSQVGPSGRDSSRTASGREPGGAGDAKLGVSKSGRTMQETAEVSDGDLVKQSLNGDRRSFDVLIIRYQRLAYGKAKEKLSHHEDAEEVTQNAFIKAYQSLTELKEHGAFRGWLMMIVTRLSLNYRRGRALRVMQPLEGPASGEADEVKKIDPVSTQPGPEEVMVAQEMNVRLAKALEALPERTRLILEMFTRDKLQQKDIAKKLKMSVEAVKWHVFSARKQLDKLINGTSGQTEEE